MREKILETWEINQSIINKSPCERKLPRPILDNVNYAPGPDFGPIGLQCT